MTTLAATHDRYLELAARSIDGPLSSTDSAALARHLAVCATCRVADDELHDDARELRRLLVGAPTERVSQAVVRAERRPVRRHPTWALVAAAAAALLLAVGAVGSGAVLLSVRADRIGPLDPTWDRALPTGAGDRGSSIRAVAPAPRPDGFMLVAVGVDAAGGHVWRSSDGASWTTDGEMGSFLRGRPQAVAASGGRVIVVGTRIDEAGTPQATIWTSADDERWSRTSVAGSTGLLAVAATPARIVVAGASRSGQGAPIWTSADGQAWVAVTDPSPFQGSTVTGVAVGGPGFVAVGYDDRGAVAWSSEDGLGWRRRRSPVVICGASRP